MFVAEKVGNNTPINASQWTSKPSEFEWHSRAFLCGYMRCTTTLQKEFYGGLQVLQRSEIGGYQGFLYWSHEVLCRDVWMRMVWSCTHVSASKLIEPLLKFRCAKLWPAVSDEDLWGASAIAALPQNLNHEWRSRPTYQKHFEPFGVIVHQCLTWYRLKNEPQMSAWAHCHVA